MNNLSVVSSCIDSFKTFVQNATRDTTVNQEKIINTNTFTSYHSFCFWNHNNRSCPITKTFRIRKNNFSGDRDNIDKILKNGVFENRYGLTLDQLHMLCNYFSLNLLLSYEIPDRGVMTRSRNSLFGKPTSSYY